MEVMASSSFPSDVPLNDAVGLMSSPEGRLQIAMYHDLIKKQHDSRSANRMGT